MTAYLLSGAALVGLPSRLAAGHSQQIRSDDVHHTLSTSARSRRVDCTKERRANGVVCNSCQPTSDARKERPA
jgi:hypothetical protein